MGLTQADDGLRKIPSQDREESEGGSAALKLYLDLFSDVWKFLFTKTIFQRNVHS